MSKLALVFAVSSLLIVSSIESAVRADVTSGNASAFGASANFNMTNSFFTTNFSLAPTPTVSGSASPPFSNSNSAASAISTVTGGPAVGAFSTGTLNVTASSTANGLAGTQSSNALSHAEFVGGGGALGDPGFGSLFDFFLLSAQSTAQVSGDSGVLAPSGSTTLSSFALFTVGNTFNLNSTIFGNTTPAANTTFVINDSFLTGGAGLFNGNITVVLNEQILTGNGSTTQDISVNAIHITLNNFSYNDPSINPFVASGEIIVGQSHAGLTATDPVISGAQPVPEPSSLAMLGLAGVAGAIRRYRRRNLGPR